MTTSALIRAADQHGNPTSGAADSVGRYDVAVDRLLRYHPDVISSMESFVADEPDFPMGLVLATYLSLTSTDTPDIPGAAELVGSLRGLTLNERETAHLHALETWLAGDWHGTSRQLDALLVRWPADLLGLLVAHQLDFFLGDPDNLRDRVGRSIGAVDRDDPHHGFLLGMRAFGLEESGNYELAEASGLAALDRNPDDVWAVHAVAHVYEMRGQVDEGIRFMRGRQDDWSRDNLFSVHNWWHLGLYLLEAGRIEDVLGIYDTTIHNESSAGVPLEMLDASAMLWRLMLDGHDTGGRFTPLADAWATRTVDAPWYVFNDLHAVMALAGAGRLDDAMAVIARLERDAAAEPMTSNRWMTLEVGLPASRALLAYVEGRYDAVVDELMPIRRSSRRFGGSMAQRDVLQRTLADSALRSGQLDLARALLSERLSVRETSVYGWQRQAQLMGQLGDARAAAEAEARAAGYRAAFSAAAVSAG